MDNYTLEDFDVEKAKREWQAQQRAAAYAHAINCPIDVKEQAAEIVDTVLPAKI